MLLMSNIEPSVGVKRIKRELQMHSYSYLIYTVSGLEFRSCMYFKAYLGNPRLNRLQLILNL